MHFITYLLIVLAGDSQGIYLPITYCRNGVVDDSCFSVVPRNGVVYLVLIELYLFPYLIIIHLCFGK